MAGVPKTPLVAALTRLMQLGRPYRRLLVISFACMAVVGATTGAYAWLMGPALRFLLSGGTQGLGLVAEVFPQVATWPRASLLKALPVVVVTIGAVKGVGYLGQFYFVGLFGQRVVVDLRRQLFVRLLTLSPTQLTQRLSGDLLSRFTSDVAAVEAAATWTIASYLRDSLQILILGGVALWLSWKLALATLVIVPIAVLPASRLTRSLMRRTREGQKALGALAGQVQEGLGAVRTIQAFNAEGSELRRFEHQGRAVEKSLTRAAWSRAAVPGVMEILASAAIAGSLGWATWANSIEPETLVSFLGALVLLYQPAKDLGRVSQFAVPAAAALERLHEVMSLAVPVVDAPKAVTLARMQEAVTLTRVHFAWGHRPALDGVTLELRRGEVTALVGPSGSGKSTLTALLLRFEAPSQGTISIDGVEVSTATVSSVRAQFALVTQDAMLFSATVADNLRVGRPTATRAELEAAARVAQAHEFISALPKGYDTPIGERGVTLSGGQKQRLCLARAVLSDAPMLVLDEATSNLDPTSEREVEAALRAVLVGRTALVIAHRLSSIQRANRIVVLESGRVVEEGSHEVLLSRHGLYAKLWAQQHG